MRTDEENIRKYIIDYLKGDASADEIQLIRNWLAESDENKKTFDELSDIWRATSPQNKNEFDTKSGFFKVKHKLWAENKPHSHSKNNEPHTIKYYKVALRVAAVLIVGLILGVLIISQSKNASLTASENTITEITAPLGSKSKISLPDGTKVWLNAGSTIKYNALFNTINRTVSLEGEAYFDVVKKTDKPFLVKTSDVTIKVLGTAFNLKAYPNEGSIETTLVRGSLIVEQGKSKKEITQTILAPKQRATYIKQSGKMLLSETETQVLRKEKVNQPELAKGKVLVSKEIDTEIFTAWKDNRLVFRNESFESLAVKLERWYGVKIELADNEIENYHFNGTIENETINDVMEIIRITLPIKFTISHNHITITKQK